ncbi:hypothetical protein Pfo_011367 [Paulownia fortunei]|nr:hypothetical protein Pfo_011367 [Paulownia fortunei]
MEIKPNSLLCYWGIFVLYFHVDCRVKYLLCPLENKVPPTHLISFFNDANKPIPALFSGPQSPPPPEIQKRYQNGRKGGGVKSQEHPSRGSKATA